MSEILQHCSIETDLEEYTRQMADARARNDREAATRASDDFVSRVKAGMRGPERKTTRLSDIGKRAD